MAPDVTKASGNNVESSETDKKVQTTWKQTKHGTNATTEGELLLSAKKNGNKESISGCISFLQENRIFVHILKYGEEN